MSGLGKNKHREFVQASGEMTAEQFVSFLGTSFERIERACKNGAIVFTCMDWRRMPELVAAGRTVFTELKNLCVWVKSNAGMGAFYRSQHELVFGWKVGDQEHTNNFGLGAGGRHRSNVWRYAGGSSFSPDRAEELKAHPTVKNLVMVSDAIRDVSNRGEIVLDVFGGAGTTLIAAQKTGRRARLLELDPAYCDVTVRRWEALTGKHATLQASGMSFEDVASDRLGDGSAAGEGGMSDDQPPDRPKRGYRYPPVAHQFKKGASGNPRGRPPKATRALTPRQVRRDIFDAAEAQTRIRTAKGERTVSVIEAVYMRLVQKALAGHGPSMRKILDMYEKACKDHYALHERAFSWNEFVESEVVNSAGEPHRRNGDLVDQTRTKTRRY